MTRRGELVAGVLVGITLFGATWLAAAVGYWLTGIRG